MEKVIFIGGTSYSGSTMLDMILANDPKGYSLGEINALFRPYRKHHFEEIERLKKDDKWRKILKAGENELYKNLFRYFPEIDFFVDSSKNPLWINKHIKILVNKNIEVKNVCIFKTPVEIAYSFNKRGLSNQWERTWENYHRLYFALISDFKTVAYKDLVNNDTTLKKLCEYLEIPFFETKKNFWEKQHQTFFGNNRARIHTNNLNSEGEEKLDLSKRKDEYRKIYYEEVHDKDFISSVIKIMDRNNNLEKISSILENYNILNENVDNNSLLTKSIVFNAYSIKLRKINEILSILKAKICIL